MTSAVLQGAPFATVDTDIWIDLPVRQYVRILTIAQKLGAQILSRTVIALRDDNRIDFLYRVDGLASFRTEWRRAISMTWAGQNVRVLPLARLIKSKEAAARPKDLAALPTLRAYLQSVAIGGV